MSPLLGVQGRLGAGLGVALISAAAFGTSGAFAKPLLESGWSPVAAVAVRLGGAAALLALPGLFALRGRYGALLLRWKSILLYGLFGGVTVQVAYFHAIQYVSIGMALLIECLGVVLVAVWVWLRTLRRPGKLTLAGMGVAVVGLAVVLNPGDLASVDPRGLAWAGLAAIGVAVYFVTAAGESEVPAVAFVASGLGVGAVGLLLVGLVGVVPLRGSYADVPLFGGYWPWWVPLLELVVVAAVTAYVCGFSAARTLGATVAGFVGLTEVIFAITWAWLLLREIPSLAQLVGGVVLLLGVAAVQRGSQLDALAIVGGGCVRDDGALGRLSKAG